jgi:hypothetical protein
MGHHQWTHVLVARRQQSLLTSTESTIMWRRCIAGLRLLSNL